MIFEYERELPNLTKKGSILPVSSVLWKMAKEALQNDGDMHCRTIDEFAIFALEPGSDQIHITSRINRDSGSKTATAEDICAAVTSALDSYGMQWTTDH
jgi:hypothetical protein